jgi:hypothetical protein
VAVVDLVERVCKVLAQQVALVVSVLLHIQHLHTQLELVIKVIMLAVAAGQVFHLAQVDHLVLVA